MSVVEGNRGEHVLQVATKALELARYTLQITKNDKIFVLEYKEQVTDKINSDVIDIYRFVNMANNIHVRTKDDYDRRRKLQLSARELCDDLLLLIGLAKPIFHLKTKRVEYWTGKVVETKAMITKWYEKNLDMYKKLKL